MSSGQKTPLWKLPPLMQLPRLPSPDPSRQMTLEKYLGMAKNSTFRFDKLDLSDEVLKKVILSEIEKIPDAWGMKNNKMKYYEMIAIETFKRTGILLSVNSIRNVYKCAKDNLRNRLRTAVVTKRLTGMEVEEYMWKWDYYGYIRFYREQTKDWEKQLQNEIVMLKGNAAIPYVERFKVEEEDDTLMHVEEAPYEEDDMQWNSNQGGTPNYQEQQYQPPAQYTHSPPQQAVSQDNVSSTVAVNNFAVEMDQIAYQANRIAQEQPDNIKLLRKALFDTVLAFDDKSYDNVGQLFKELAAKHSK